MAIYSFNAHLAFSVQQVIDCGQSKYSLGCSGGYLSGAFDYLKADGITTEFEYPYESGNTGRSHACKPHKSKFKIESYKVLESGNCASLKKELQLKPVSVGISSQGLQFYQEGIYSQRCDNKIDHAVLLIGFDNKKGWKIKNSWGNSWG